MNKTLSFTKLATVAFTLGFISPTINNNSTISSISQIEFSIINSAEAREERNQNRNRNVNRNSNRNTNVNVNKNTNKNTNVNVNVNNNSRKPRPLGVLAGMAIGTAVVASAMSPSCTTVIVNGNSYKKCDGTYFRQNGANYVVVKSPY